MTQCTKGERAGGERERNWSVMIEVRVMGREATSMEAGVGGRKSSGEGRKGRGERAEGGGERSVGERGKVM